MRKWRIATWQEPQSQTNTLSVGLSTNWSNVSGSTTTNLIVIQPDPGKPAVFYRLFYQTP